MGWGRIIGRIANLQTNGLPQFLFYMSGGEVLDIIGRK